MTFREAYKKIIALFFLFCLVSHPLPGDTGKKDPKKAISVSLFIPGVEQIRNRQILKGGLFLGAFTATIVGALVANARGNDYYERYLASDDVDEIIELRRKAEQSYKTRNYLILGIFVVELVHLVDLKFFSGKKGGLKGEIKNNSIRLGFYYSF